MADNNNNDARNSGQGVRGGGYSTNRLFLIFSLLSFVVAMINIRFHHLFHDEHVHDRSLRQFQERFHTSRGEEGGGGDPGGGRRPRSGEEGGGPRHKLAGLRCAEEYGGPDDAYAETEMAFWSDIPSDACYKSPFMDDDVERYLAFEPDHGGWNNIRMAMETALVMSHAMGRTLVLP